MKKNKQKSYLALGLLSAMASIPLMGMTGVSAAEIVSTTNTQAPSRMHVGEDSKNENGARAGIFKGKGVIGTITSISGTIITLTNRAGVIYTVDAANATVTKDGVASSLSGILVGDMIMAQGTVSGKTVVATAIHDGMKLGKGVTPGEMAYKPMVAGTVTSVSGNTLTVTGKNAVHYTVDGTNAKVMKSKLGKKPATETLSSILVGDTVRVQGSLTGTNIIATNILDGVVPVRAMNTTARTRSAKTTAGQ